MHTLTLLKHPSRYEMLPLPHPQEKNILKFLPCFVFVLEFFMSGTI